jgi:hypothetical protein
MSDFIHEESESDFEDNLVSQVLPVANLGKNVDLSAPPATGEEYLYRVR